MDAKLTSDIQEYRTMLETLRSGKINLPITNSDRYHADQLISAIVRGSQKELRMFAKNMNGDLHSVPGSSMVEDIRAASERGVKIRVLLSHSPERLSPLLTELFALRHAGKDVNISLAKTTLLDQVKEKYKVLNYFTVGDRSMYRREYDIDRKIAVGNFNDPGTANTLIAMFDSSPVLQD